MSGKFCIDGDGIAGGSRTSDTIAGFTRTPRLRGALKTLRPIVTRAPCLLRSICNPSPFSDSYKHHGPEARVTNKFAVIRRGDQRGYVLPLVLLILALAAAAMTGICRMSLEKAVLANRAQADLQQRWAVITFREVLLPKAESILKNSGNQSNALRRTVQLGGHAFTLIFGDEQAKANVNLLYAKSGLSGAERNIRAIVTASNGAVPVELHPIPGIGKQFGLLDAPDDELPAFETFEQMLGRSSPADLIATHGTNPSLASQLTCWGDGSLHLQRAAKESVRAVLAADLPDAEINRFLNLRTKDPTAKIADLLDTANFPDATRQRVEYLMSDDTSCHSLWIISDSGRRIRYDLTIAEGSLVTSFSW